MEGVTPGGKRVEATHFHVIRSRRGPLLPRTALPGVGGLQPLPDRIGNFEALPDSSRHRRRRPAGGCRAAVRRAPSTGPYAAACSARRGSPQPRGSPIPASRYVGPSLPPGTCGRSDRAGRAAGAARTSSSGGGPPRPCSGMTAMTGGERGERAGGRWFVGEGGPSGILLGRYGRRSRWHGPSTVPSLLFHLNLRTVGEFPLRARAGTCGSENGTTGCKFGPLSHSARLSAAVLPSEIPVKAPASATRAAAGSK